MGKISRRRWTENMKPKKPLISVIIPHLNQPDGLEACLGSLSSQTLERSAFEVIVVDNGSTSLPRAIVGRYPGTLLLQELKPGPGPARNRGAEAASADIFAFTDSDCRAHPDWLACALCTVQGAPQRTILGGDVRIWREPNTEITALEAYESVFAYRFKLYIEQLGFCGTGNLIVRKSDFDNVGPFRGIDVAEDIEWGQRARRRLHFPLCFGDDRVSPRTSIASRIIGQMGSSHSACRECGKQERSVASSMGVSCFSDPAFAGH